MMTRKILIISKSFYPAISPRTFRTTELAKEFSRQGHSVTVMLPESQKSDKTLSYAGEIGVKLAFYPGLNWKELGYSRIIGDLKRKFGRLLYMLFDYPAIEIYFKLPGYLKKVKEKYDLMITIAVPHEIHWAAAKIQSGKKIADTWVADCGDPFVGNTLESFKRPFYFKYLENSFLKNADFVSVPEKGSIKGYNPLYHDKFRVISQGFNFTEIPLPVFKESDEKVKFAYAGGVASVGIRSPHKMIEHLNSLDNTNWEFHIFSRNSESLKELANKSEGRLVLHDVVPRNELLPNLAKMDFLVNLDNGSPTATPSKLIDYSIAGRPVLNITPENPEVNRINAFLQRDYSDALIIKDLENYNIVNVAKKFVELIK